MSRRRRWRAISQARSAAPGAAEENLGEDLGELARTAFARGRFDSDPAERLRWLDRAHRLQPADPLLALVLAEALLESDPGRACRLLGAVVRRRDSREAWLLLAAARQRAGDPRGAASALAHVLNRHAIPITLAGFADALARAAGAPGWCGLAADGQVLVGPAGTRPARRLERDGSLHVEACGAALLGSPLRPDRLARTEGFAEDDGAGGVRGWAWLPANPDRAPRLTLRDAAGAAFPLGTDGPWTQDGEALARRRNFHVTAEAVAGLAPPLRVLGEDGRDLLGSPLPHGPQRALLRARGALPRRRARPGKVSVIVPVHGGGRVVLDCLRSVQATLPDFANLTVVNDGGVEPDLDAWLARAAAAGRLRLVSRTGVPGFPAAANAGLDLAERAGTDALLLNSDTLVAGPWIDDLRAVAYGARDIGTVTPLSNSGSILSYPRPDGANAMPDGRTTRRLAAAARAANFGAAPEIPVGVGFCLYIRRDCLRETGRFRTDLFSQGYGEENDLCLRASALGWRHVAAPGVFVAHLGGVSMGGAAAGLRQRNAAILERLHPGYHDRIEDWLRSDTLLPYRRALDLRLWRPARAAAPAVAIVTHDRGGGVERAVAAHLAALAVAGERVLLLRPAQRAGGAAVRIEEPGTAWHNLAFALPAESAAVVELLRRARVRRVVVHHLLGHHEAVRELPARLGVPYEVRVHDYASLCPRVALLGVRESYCGEPNLAGCARCIAQAGSAIEGVTDAGALRRASAGLLRGAERVSAPSRDTAARLGRHFPGVRAEVAPHEPIVGPAACAGRPGGSRIAVVGGIGPAKGYRVLLAMARDAARRALPLSFVVVGHTPGDGALLDTGRAFVTGPFAEEEADALIRAQGAAMAFIPSVVPETWCYALSDCWRAGLAVAAFDIGAQAERIRASGTGFLLPLGTRPARINDALLAACGAFRHERAFQNR